MIASEEKIETIRQEYEEAVKSGNKKEAINALQRKYPIFKKARFAHFDSRNESARKGIDRHSVLERFVKIEMKRENIEPLTKEETELIQMFIDWSKINVKKFLWSEAHCYSKELWVGGISDNGAELKDGTYAVIDYKSGREAYITNFIQACLYAIQINENGLFSENGEHSKKLDKPIEKIVIIPFGAEKMPPNKDIIRNVSDFTRGSECAVELYRLIGLDERIKQ